MSVKERRFLEHFLEAGEVGIATGGFAEVGIKLEGFFEHEDGVFGFAEAGVVAAGVVEEDGFVEEGAGSVEKDVEGGAGVAKFVETEGFVDVTAGFKRGCLAEPAGDVEGVVPTFFAHEAEGENFQDVGAAQGVGGKLMEFLPDVFIHAELEIAVGGQNNALVVFDHERMGSE